MANIQSTPNPQAGGGSRGEPAPEPPAADRGRDAAESDPADPAAATGHTTPGAGSAVDLGDELTATDGSAAGDPNPSAL